MAVNNEIISMSDGCKTPDGRHIHRDSDHCLLCWQPQSTTKQASRVLVVTISGEDSERELVDRLAEIVEAQVRGVFSVVMLIEDRNRVTPTPKLAELEVCAS
jgi:hypothetical protein